MLNIGRSSNGRTFAFEAKNFGSIPSLPAMSLKEFNKLFGVQENPSVEQNRFVQRINQTIFSTIEKNPYPDNYEILFRDVCYQAGINANDFISRANTFNYDVSLNIPSLRTLTKDDFMETLKILILLYKSINPRNIPRLNQSIELALGMTVNDLSVRWKDGLFYPSGAKELDEKLINENIEWLEEFPNARERFITALDHFKKSLKDSSSRKDAITNAYSAIEFLAQKALGNKKNFEDNSNPLVNLIGLVSEYKNILHYYKQIAHEYSSRHAGSEFSHIETEAFIYLTGILMRIIREKITLTS